MPIWGGGAGSPSNTMWPGSKPTSVPSSILIHPAVLPQQRIRGFAIMRYINLLLTLTLTLTTDMGQKLGAVPFYGRTGSPSNTMWPGPRPTSVPSGILIYPTVWPQYANVTDRTDRIGQRPDSIGRTVLQTVAQKLEMPSVERWYLPHS